MKYVYIFLLSIFIYTSCKEITCPSFPVELKKYLPLKGNEICKFSNDIDTLTFNIIEDTVLAPHNYKSNCDCICSVEKSQITNKDNEFNIQLRNNIRSSGERNENYEFEIIINEESLVKSFTSNDKLKDTIIIVTDNMRFSKIMMIKNHGIVEIKDNLYNCTWRLVE